MASQTYLRRLRKEYRNILKEPAPHIHARPLPSNILKWYFIIEGPKDTPYAGGIYMGRLQFPSEYPYKPPAVYMITPNGRFSCNQRLCLSMSDFHPETWNPLWSVSAVLTGLLSFMLGSEDTAGSMRSSDREKRILARASHAFNRSDKTFKDLFPDFVKSEEEIAKDKAAQERLTGRGGNRNDEDVMNANNESLVSLIGWLGVFSLIVYAVFRMITNPVI